MMRPRAEPRAGPSPPLSPARGRLPRWRRDCPTSTGRRSSPEVQSVFDTLQKACGRVLNFYRLMAHHARSVPPFLAWYPVLREGALDLKLRYLAYVRASQLNRCRYCVTHNGAAASPRRRFPGAIRRARRVPDEPALLGARAPGARYAEEMTLRVQVDPALVETLRQPSRRRRRWCSSPSPSPRPTSPTASTRRSVPSSNAIRPATADTVHAAAQRIRQLLST